MRNYACIDMNTDISRKLAASVLSILTPEQKIDLNERESRELLLMNPSYGIEYFKRKFDKKAYDAQ